MQAAEYNLLELATWGASWTVAGALEPAQPAAGRPSSAEIN